MTATRVFIIVLVLIAVLFGITLVWAHRSGASAPSAKELVQKWQSKFNNLGRMNPDDLLCPQRKNSTITFPPGVGKVQATIKKDSNDLVRRLMLTVPVAGGAISLKFAPNPGDKRATTNDMNLVPGETNTLAVFPPGGVLTLTRSPSPAPATIEIR